MNFKADKGDLRKLETDLNRLPQAFAVIHAKYSHALAGGWKKSILDVNAVDTYRYLFSVAVRAASGETNAAEFVIDTSGNSAVFYPDIVERGRDPRNGYAKTKSGTDAFGGRWPAGKSLEAQHDADLLDTITVRTLDDFLHG